ncbi:MAG: Acyl carrier protein [Phycisphaerae bacterium]|nr:Acyl carrier protein [Phycisphaerae bacterium]
MDHLLRLQRIFRDAFDDDALTITPQTSHDDLDGWDSVQQVKLILSIEAAYGIQFDIEQVTRFKTVADFIAAIESQQSSKA